MSLRRYALLALLATPTLVSAAVSDRVRDAATATYFHGMTREIAEREAGPIAVPELLELLRDPKFPRRDNVVAFLAYLGGAESTTALERLLDEPPAPLTAPEEARARVLVPHALGRIAGRGEPQALDALLRMTRSAGPLRKEAVAALAFANAPAARKRLAAIAKDASNPSLAATARRAIDLMNEPAAPPAAPAITYTPDPSTVSHQHGITFANHVAVSNPMTSLRLESVLADATLRAARADYDGDVPCCTALVRSGLAGTFGSAGDGLDTIDSAAELSSVFNFNVGRMRVVNTINYCGGAGTNIIGCGSTPGNEIVVVRLSGLDTEAILWIHEYGHNLGLDHATDNRDIMFPTDNGNNEGLTTDECHAFHQPAGGSAALLTAIGACTDDGDTWANPIDNCPFTANEDQADSNGNGIGDACEACPSGDSDGDGVCDNVDDCPNVADPSQADLDDDGFGDACETGARLADIDLSGLVDGADLAALGRAFGSSSGQARYDPRVDLDRDGQVDGADLSLLAGQFGKADP
jgi:predicted Zn-dependent protease